MSDCKPVYELGNPYKIIDHTKGHRKVIIACSLRELVNTARVLFNFPVESTLTVVLEQDGTEIDDEEYFATLEKNTELMILNGNQKWISAKAKKSTLIVVDDTDFSDNHIEQINISKYQHLQIKTLVSSLYTKPSHISRLPATDLEMLSDMDPDSVVDVISDKLFIEQLKEVSTKFLADKRQVKESITLLQL